MIGDLDENMTLTGVYIDGWGRRAKCFNRNKSYV